MADLVLHDVSKYLAGEHGIRRYLGDSYWAPDYGARLSEMDRTRDFSDDLATRDMLLSRLATKRSGVFSIQSRPRTTGVAIARRAQSRIARDRSFISIARSRRSLTTGVAPSCTTFDRANTSPTRTFRCSGRRPISPWRSTRCVSRAVGALRWRATAQLFRWNRDKKFPATVFSVRPRQPRRYIQ